MGLVESLLEPQSTTASEPLSNDGSPKADHSAVKNGKETTEPPVALDAATTRFSLPLHVVTPYLSRTPDWGPVGEIVYKRTYEYEGEGWALTCKRVVELCYTLQKRHCLKNNRPWNDSKSMVSACEMYDLMWNMKFLPPGRGLDCGRIDLIDKKGGAVLNNCFSGDTKVCLTDGSVRRLDSIQTPVEVYTSCGPRLAYPCRFGQQQLQQVVVAPFSVRSNVRHSMRATRNHKWLLADGTETTELAVGDVLAATEVAETAHHPDGFAHGFVFGDGTKRPQTNISYQLRLCGEKNRFADRLKKASFFHHSYLMESGDEMLVFHSETNLKALPTCHEASFIQGWMAADGTHGNGLDTQDVEAVDWVYNHGWRFGYTVVGHSTDARTTNLGPRSAPLHRLKLSPSTAWTVKELREDRVEDVYCLTVPDVGNFVLANGVLTGNCGFTSTKDASDADPFCWAMDMLALGVGVGFDTLGNFEVIGPNKNTKEILSVHKVKDSREGWVDALRLLLNSYFKGSASIVFNYEGIRAAGKPLKTLGGVSSGPQPLIDLFVSLRKLLDPRIGTTLTQVDIADIFMLIGKCIVSGNKRRSAELGLGTHTAYTRLKEPNESGIYDHEWRWAANLSVVADPSSDHTQLVQAIEDGCEVGVYWLKNAQKYGRMGRRPDNKDQKAQGTNPCSEQTLEDRELCCVSSDTRILTREGYPRIGEVVGKSVDVWNGKTWSSVVPFKASSNKKLYRVTLSDGSHLDVTDNHGWSARTSTQSNFRKIETKALQAGMVLERCEVFKSEQGVSVPWAYQAGWIAGDGYIDGKRVMGLVQKSEYSILETLGGSAYKEQHPAQYTAPFKRVNLSEVVDFSFAKELRNCETGLPDEVFTWDADSVAAFFGGWIDTDGSLRQQEGTDAYILASSNRRMLVDAQILLRKIGVNYSTISLYRTPGTSTNYCKSSKGLWNLYIPSFNAAPISTKLKKAEVFGDRYKINNAHPEGAKIDRARRQKVVKIEELEGVHDTFCFTEPSRGMGVFGNCLTYQCLVEVFPSRHTDYYDLQHTLKYAYLYAKSITLAETHDPRTNDIINRNRRIGCSMSGIVPACEKFGRYEFLNKFLPSGYKYIQALDDRYSAWFGINRSIKTTSVKPSGTVSKLPGVAPGVHWPHSEYYFQVIRFSNKSPYLDPLRKAGYRCVDLVNEPNMVAVYFPVKEENFERSKQEISLWEQMELVAQVQHQWSDNQVSATFTFSEQERESIGSALELYASRLKSATFFPKDVKQFEHAPMQEITKEEYEEAMKTIKPVENLSPVKELQDKFCDGAACEI